MKSNIEAEPSQTNRRCDSLGMGDDDRAVNFRMGDDDRAVNLPQYARRASAATPANELRQARASPMLGEGTSEWHRFGAATDMEEDEPRCSGAHPRTGCFSKLYFLLAGILCSTFVHTRSQAPQQDANTGLWETPLKLTASTTPRRPGPVITPCKARSAWAATS